MVDERVAEAILDTQDPLDLRKNNGKVESSFDEFWEELQKYLDELVTPVNERRHGDTMYLPIAISVRDLRERIEERLLKRFPGDYHLKNGSVYNSGQRILMQPLLCDILADFK